MTYGAYMAYGSIGDLPLFRFEGRVLIKSMAAVGSVIKKVSQSGSSDVATFTKSLWCVKTPVIKEGSNYRQQKTIQVDKYEVIISI